MVGVHDAIFLNAGARANHNWRKVAAQHRPVPHTGKVADFHVADHIGILCNKDVLSHTRHDAFERQ